MEMKSAAALRITQFGVNRNQDLKHVANNAVVFCGWQVELHQLPGWATLLTVKKQRLAKNRKRKYRQLLQRNAC